MAKGVKMPPRSSASQISGWTPRSRKVVVAGTLPGSAGASVSVVDGSLES